MSYLPSNFVDWATAAVAGEADILASSEDSKVSVATSKASQGRGRFPE